MYLEGNPYNDIEHGRWPMPHGMVGRPSAFFNRIPVFSTMGRGPRGPRGAMVWAATGEYADRDRWYIPVGELTVNEGDEPQSGDMVFLKVGDALAIGTVVEGDGETVVVSKRLADLHGFEFRPARPPRH